MGKERTKHPAQKPEKVFKPFIEYFTNPNDVVLDPFHGVGTTMKVCRDLGRSCIGIEISPKYCGMTKNRVFPKEKPLISDIEYKFEVFEGG